ncbi:hypothetical protein HB943_16355 [Listeria weihenstephanensis]|uniref:Immunity protein Imm3 n=1 Tax=Listeria weihenstephanensis TaxID=1006155 RepID=A0A841ZA39_9LIST|nr:Imm3 family immunity protein [Listeria weihenstephanensis]MBC1502175.1 hypothetical protein [Listeria weihenstephanensis]
MKDWEYEELIKAINESYENFLKIGRGEKFAIARAFNEYADMGEIEDIITDIAIGEILLYQDKVFIGYIKGITGRLSGVKKDNLKNELSDEQIENLLDRIVVVIKGLKNKPNDRDPVA